MISIESVPSKEETIALLREAFPGVWVREDGAFRTEGDAIRWRPGDIECADPPNFSLVATDDGRVGIGPEIMNDRPSRLTATQMYAILVHMLRWGVATVRE